MTSWLLTAVFALGSPAEALPRMSIAAGAPCSTCHLSANGGGVRTEIGYGSMERVGMFAWEDLGLDPGEGSNAYLDGKVLVGLDTRYQIARLGQPSPGEDGGVDIPDYGIFPMQFQPYLGIRPVESVTVHGSYSPAPEGDDMCKPAYPGMSCLEAAVQIQPAGNLPRLRAGMLQPSIGIRHDDHTLYVRGDASNPRRPVIPPNYAEWGGEVSYHPGPSVRVEAGGFDTANLEAANAAFPHAVGEGAWIGRVTYMPKIEWVASVQAEEEDEFADFDDEVPEFAPQPGLRATLHLGASVYGSGDLRIENYFAAAGTDDGAIVRVEVARGQRAEDHRVFNVLAGASYNLRDWLVLEARGERANTESGDTSYQTDQLVVGAQLFPLPGLELRPEYRLVKTARSLFGHTTLHLHAFF